MINVGEMGLAVAARGIACEGNGRKARVWDVKFDRCEFSVAWLGKESHIGESKLEIKIKLPD